jgi:ClpP class serine protease
MLWLIKHEAAVELQRVRELGLHLQLTEAQRKEFAERAVESTLSGVPRNYQVAGDIAEIRVEGVLTPKPDLFAFYFGGGNTTYESIQQALALAESDGGVKKISWFVASPGGLTEGLFDCLGAIQACRKPMMVRASMADSAAYAIAAVAGRTGKIEATSAAAEFGSIGVARRYFVDKEHIVEIASTEAPNKRPDPTTPEGQAVIRGELDAVHELFAEAIAAGRGTTLKDVNQNFGRGGVLLAGEAKRRGMIDKIAKPTLRALPTTDSSRTAEETEAPERAPEQTQASVDDDGTITKERVMKLTKEELKAQNLELYAALIAEGEAAGEAKERKRVNAHVKLGKSSGSRELSDKFIASGVSAMDEEAFAEYQSAAMNRRDTDARQAESDTAVAAVAGATPPPATGAPAVATTEAAPDLGDQVVALIDAQRGGSPKPKAQASA